MIWASIRNSTAAAASIRGNSKLFSSAAARQEQPLWLTSLLQNKCASGKKIRKWPSTLNEDQLHARLTALERLGFKGKDLEKLLPSVVNGIDVEKRLDLLSASLEDLDLQQIRSSIISQQKRWLFRGSSDDFADKLQNLHSLLAIFKRHKADLTKWVVQLLPASRAKSEETLAFLVKLAGSDRGARQMIQRFPIILQFDVEKYIKPRLELLRNIGFSEEQLSKIVVQYPRILSVAREERLNSMMVFLNDRIGLSSEEICKLLISFPRLSTSTCEAVSKRLEYFISCGVDRDKIRMILKKNPSVMSLNVETGLKPKMEFLSSIGVTEKRLVNFLSMHAGVLGRTKEGLEARFNHLMKLGLSREECCELFRRHPSIFNLRDELLNEKIGFYTRVMKQKIKTMTRFPGFLTYSLDARVKPRIAFGSWLHLSGLAKREYLPYYFIVLSDEAFLSKFLVNDEAAAEAYKRFQ